VDDVCTGGVTCPPKGGNAGATCRPSAGSCDLAETCDGVNEACPADVFRPSSYVCRAAAHPECDVEERCTGSSAACPANAVSNTGQQCDLPFTGGCSGPGTCPPGYTRECSGTCNSSGACGMCSCQCVN
jgi:hypothetical protein